MSGLTARRGRPGAEGGAGGLAGLLVVDKPPGWTSHDVVARVRTLLGVRRVGHAGTLDPDATGVLLVGVGRATRLLRFLAGMQKEYSAEIVLGVATDTLDASGAVVGEWDMAGVSPDDVSAAAASLTGQVEQVPPMVSAVKVGGRRLHQLARRGVEVERRARTVTVARFDVAPTADRGVYLARVTCSSGTYVRALAADLGTALGGGAHLRNLRRHRVGSFTEAEARPVGGLDPGDLLPPVEAVRDLDRVALGDEMAALVARGLPLDRVPAGAVGAGPWAVVDGSGVLLAVYEATGSDRIRPAVVLAPA